jgi:carboxymethylenebutenolidase
MHMRERLWLALAILAAAGMITVASKEAKRPMNGVRLMEKPGLEIVSSDIAYFGGVKGRYAEPKQGGDWPGVVMVHEWWGLNDHIKRVAEQLAAQGYRVLAVDLHEGKMATTPEEARALVGALDQARAVENMKAAAAYLRGRGAGKIASLGWCFGGGQSLQLSLSGEPLDATVIYYGQPVLDTEKLRILKAPVLGIFGDKDQVIPLASVEAFDRALDAIGVPNSFHVYPGVGHAFANPSGVNYAEAETKDAWEKTLKFLSENLR